MITVNLTVNVGRIIPMCSEILNLQGQQTNLPAPHTHSPALPSSSNSNNRNNSNTSNSNSHTSSSSNSSSNLTPASWAWRPCPHRPAWQAVWHRPRRTEGRPRHSSKMAATPRRSRPFQHPTLSSPPMLHLRWARRQAARGRWGRTAWPTWAWTQRVSTTGHPAMPTAVLM